MGYNVDGSPQPPSGPPITSIVPSSAELFYLRNGTGATQFAVNGSGTFSGATPTTPVDLADGDPIQVTLNYDQSTFTLTETLVDLTTADTYTLTRSADIDDVAGTTGFVGFTGATGGAYSDGLISNFVFLAPEPASLGLLAVGAASLLARRRNRK